MTIERQILWLCVSRSPIDSVPFCADAHSLLHLGAKFRVCGPLCFLQPSSVPTYCEILPYAPPVHVFIVCDTLSRASYWRRSISEKWSTSSKCMCVGGCENTVLRSRCRAGFTYVRSCACVCVWFACMHFTPWDESNNLMISASRQFLIDCGRHDWFLLFPIEIYV